MKEKNKQMAQVLKSILSDITYADKSLNEASVSTLLQKAIKKRVDSLDAYKTGNRLDLAELEQKEIDILKSYLPKQMELSEIEHVVHECINKLQITTEKDFGKLMKELNTAIDPAMASRKLVSDTAKRILNDTIGK
jgi:uncharacterized protein YqeY